MDHIANIKLALKKYLLQYTQTMNYFAFLILLSAIILCTATTSSISQSAFVSSLGNDFNLVHHHDRVGASQSRYHLIQPKSDIHQTNRQRVVASSSHGQIQSALHVSSKSKSLRDIMDNDGPSPPKSNRFDTLQSPSQSHSQLIREEQERYDKLTKQLLNLSTQEITRELEHTYSIPTVAIR